MVKVFNVGDKCYSSQKDVSTRPGSGPIVGLARYKDALGIFLTFVLKLTC